MSFQIKNGVLIKYIAEPGETKAVIPKGITSIGDKAFFGCKGLAEVVIPEGITSIGSNAFRECAGLTEVVIPDGVTSIGVGAFYGCTGLRSVVIPAGVTSMEFAVFAGCAGLRSVVIPAGVTSIEGEAFSGCTGLQSVVIPDGVKSIEEEPFGAFFGCTALTSVNISLRDLRGCGDETIWRCVEIPEDETAMRSYCTALDSCPWDTRQVLEEKLLHSPLCAAAEYFERRGRFADHAAAHDADPDALWDTLMSRPDPDGDLTKLCAVRLFREFLQKKEYTARAWREMFLPKPVPASLARLLVWQQGEVTFTLDAAGVPVNVHGYPVQLGDDSIILAHPMELDEDTVKAWQNYFTAKQLTQPFIQMREPVLDGSTIRPDRYEECPIARHLLRNREKHGIIIEGILEYGWDDRAKVDIKFLDCTAEVFEPDVYEAAEFTDDYEVCNFRFDAFTRQVNHIALILDSLTVRDRILKDDVSVRLFLDSFTLPQILEFIDLAAQNGCLRVTAMLQQYKRDRFGSADPTGMFMLGS